MELRSLPTTEEAVRRFVEELWLPYHEELSRTITRHALARGVDLEEVEVDHRRERLREADHRTWIAVTPSERSPSRAISTDGALLEGDLAGFVTTHPTESPPVFDHPEQLVIDDLYVRPPYRGRGLGRRLVERAKADAIEAGCDELGLDVDRGNDRALEFYRELGFEAHRYRMALDLDTT